MATTNAITTAARITGYGMVAGARADLMDRGSEREAMVAAATLAHSLAQAIERGEDFTPEQFELLAREIDSQMAFAGDRQLPARTDDWLALFTS